MENTKTITIDTGQWRDESQIGIKELSKIEISIIASMFHSKELFAKITESVNEEDFTFMINKKIFNHLKSYSNEVDFYGNEDEKNSIAEDIYAFENIPATTARRILASRPSKNIDLDIAELLDFSRKRIEVFKQHADNDEYYANIVVEDEYGEHTAIYYCGIIKEIFTTYIFNLPDELCDTLKHTHEKIIPYIQKEDFNVGMEIDENNHEDIKAFILTKNISKIENLEKLISWGKEKQIKENLFSDNRGKLLNTMYFALDYQNIEHIPDELCDALSHTVRFLMLNSNKIKKIPKNIDLLENCAALGLCNNQIEFLPDALFKLTKLSSLWLCGNMLTEIPKEIGNLVELFSLALSDNSISQLPSTINQLHKLKTVTLENTLIDESSLKHINLENIEYISFDDRLLPYLIENFHLLKKIDTINLSHSKYKIDNPIFNSLKLNIETKNWMEDNDYNGHGCVVLKTLTSE